jgi:hypothetical protein
MNRNDFQAGTIFEITFDNGYRKTVERHLITHVDPTKQKERRQADGSYAMGDYTPVHTVRYIKSRNDWAKKAQSWCSAESLAEGTYRKVEIINEDAA